MIACVNVSDLVIKKRHENYLIDGPLQGKDALLEITGMTYHVDIGKAQICRYCIVNGL